MTSPRTAWIIPLIPRRTCRSLACSRLPPGARVPCESHSLTRLHTHIHVWAHPIRTVCITVVPFVCNARPHCASATLGRSRPPAHSPINTRHLKHYILTFTFYAPPPELLGISINHILHTRPNRESRIVMPSLAQPQMHRDAFHPRSPPDPVDALVEIPRSGTQRERRPRRTRRSMDIMCRAP